MSEWSERVYAASAVKDPVRRSYLMGEIDGILAIRNCPIDPVANAGRSYSLFGEPFTVPDETLCRVRACGEVSRQSRAYLLGKARGIRGEVWVA